MTQIIKNLVTFIFILFCNLQTMQAKIPATVINSITHRSTRNLVQRLYDCQWIGNYDVRPALTQTLAILDDSTKTDEQKTKAMNHFKQELYKAIGSTQHLPTWLTFNAIENLHYKHTFCGFSSRELQQIGKWIAAATILYLGKEYIRAKINSGINWTTEKTYGPIANYMQNKLPDDIERVIAKSIQRIATETVNAPNFKKNMKTEVNEIVTTATKAALTELSSEENQKRHEEHAQRAAAAARAGFAGRHLVNGYDRTANALHWITHNSLTQGIAHGTSSVWNSYFRPRTQPPPAPLKEDHIPVPAPASAI